MSNVPPSFPTPEPAGDDAYLLASLYLDDEASSDERARVAADPQLLALVESMRATAAATAHVVAPEGLRGSHIGAALDLFDQQHRTATVDTSARATAIPAAPATITSLSERRARRVGLPSWLGAAAVATLIVGGLGFAVTLNGGGGDDAEVATAEAPSAASSTNRDTDATAEAEIDASGADMAAEAMQDESTEAEGTEETSADEEVMEEADGDALDDDEAAESPVTTVVQNPATFYAERGPINLADYEGEIAADYVVQLSGTMPVQPISESPCADSQLLDGLFGVDSFYPVIFNGRLASLIVKDGAPTTALIVGPTCEIEQD